MALTQAYAEIRPFPLNAWRSRLKLGAFKAPISPENRLPGWHSACSLSPSAINTRIGEEFRTTGAEYDLDWLGRQHGHDRELGLRAAAYDWNDYSGQLMAQRGKYLDALELRALHYPTTSTQMRIHTNSTCSVGIRGSAALDCAGRHRIDGPSYRNGLPAPLLRAIRIQLYLQRRA